MSQYPVDKYLPLTEATYCILAALVEPLHGYGVMQKIDVMTRGTVSVGAGTLYGAFSTLEKEKLIDMVVEDGRRKVYALTAKGSAVLKAEIQRLSNMVTYGRDALNAVQE